MYRISKVIVVRANDGNTRYTACCILEDKNNSDERILVDMPNMEKLIHNELGKDNLYYGMTTHIITNYARKNRLIEHTVKVIGNTRSLNKKARELGIASMTGKCDISSIMESRVDVDWVQNI